MGYQGQRRQLVEWAEKKGQEGIKHYQLNNNRLSIDGLIAPGIDADEDERK
jgi:hypothetical protein